MSQSHGIKGGTTDDTFQELCVLWESGASVGVDIYLKTFKTIHMHKKLYNTLKGWKKKQTKKLNNKSSLSCLTLLESGFLCEGLVSDYTQHSKECDFIHVLTNVCSETEMSSFQHNT